MITGFLRPICSLKLNFDFVLGGPEVIQREIYDIGLISCMLRECKVLMYNSS